MKITLDKANAKAMIRNDPKNATIKSVKPLSKLEITEREHQAEKESEFKADMKQDTSKILRLESAIYRAVMTEPPSRKGVIRIALNYVSMLYEIEQVTPNTKGYYLFDNYLTFIRKFLHNTKK